ncbi:unnamed protein product [Bursaphelenchus xylophilus]|uniref:(pine wood nematode) hypothetical protein n=1 Tax=Bursaphelenchus xylophilus TaxID=6326 RepID=A0A1I7S7W6_BURXY|nr:unnamed protein product [Bursaphelenchus xylophilus]CAG9087147.1 unnamed protein product [Bursaphelenchus xylophilus]
MPSDFIRQSRIAVADGRPIGVLISFQHGRAKIFYKSEFKDAFYDEQNEGQLVLGRHYMVKDRGTEIFLLPEYDTGYEDLKVENNVLNVIHVPIKYEDLTRFIGRDCRMDDKAFRHKFLDELDFVDEDNIELLRCCRGDITVACFDTVNDFTAAVREMNDPTTAKGKRLLKGKWAPALLRDRNGEWTKLKFNPALDQIYDELQDSLLTEYNKFSKTFSPIRVNCRFPADNKQTVLKPTPVIAPHRSSAFQTFGSDQPGPSGIKQNKSNGNCREFVETRGFANMPKKISNPVFDDVQDVDDCVGRRITPPKVARWRDEPQEEITLEGRRGKGFVGIEDTGLSEIESVESEPAESEARESEVFEDTNPSFEKKPFVIPRRGFKSESDAASIVNDSSNDDWANSSFEERVGHKSDSDNGADSDVEYQRPFPVEVDAAAAEDSDPDEDSGHRFPDDHVRPTGRPDPLVKPLPKYRGALRLSSSRYTAAVAVVLGCSEDGISNVKTHMGMAKAAVTLVQGTWLLCEIVDQVIVRARVIPSPIYTRKIYERGCIRMIFFCQVDRMKNGSYFNKYLGPVTDEMFDEKIREKIRKGQKVPFGMWVEIEYNVNADTWKIRKEHRHYSGPLVLKDEQSFFFEKIEKDKTKTQKRMRHFFCRAMKDERCPIQYYSQDLERLRIRMAKEKGPLEYMGDYLMKKVAEYKEDFSRVEKNTTNSDEEILEPIPVNLDYLEKTDFRFEPKFPEVKPKKKVLTKEEAEKMIQENKLKVREERHRKEAEKYRSFNEEQNFQQGFQMPGQNFEKREPPRKDGLDSETELNEALNFSWNEQKSRETAHDKESNQNQANPRPSRPPTAMSTQSRQPQRPGPSNVLPSATQEPSRPRPAMMASARATPGLNDLRNSVHGRSSVFDGSTQSQQPDSNLQRPRPVPFSSSRTESSIPESMKRSFHQQQSAQVQSARDEFAEQSTGPVNPQDTRPSPPRAASRSSVFSQSNFHGTSNLNVSNTFNSSHPVGNLSGVPPTFSESVRKRLPSNGDAAAKKQPDPQPSSQATRRSTRISAARPSTAIYVLDENVTNNSGPPQQENGPWKKKGLEIYDEESEEMRIDKSLKQRTIEPDILDAVLGTVVQYPIPASFEQLSFSSVKKGDADCLILRRIKDVGEVLYEPQSGQFGFMHKNNMCYDLLVGMKVRVEIFGLKKLEKDLYSFIATRKITKEKSRDAWSTTYEPEINSHNIIELTTPSGVEILLYLTSFELYKPTIIDGRYIARSEYGQIVLGRRAGTEKKPYCFIARMVNREWTLQEDSFFILNIDMSKYPRPKPFDEAPRKPTKSSTGTRRSSATLLDQEQFRHRSVDDDVFAPPKKGSTSRRSTSRQDSYQPLFGIARNKIQQSNRERNYGNQDGFGRNERNWQNSAKETSFPEQRSYEPDFGSPPSRQSAQQSFGHQEKYGENDHGRQHSGSINAHSNREGFGYDENSLGYNQTQNFPSQFVDYDDSRGFGRNSSFGNRREELDLRNESDYQPRFGMGDWNTTERSESRDFNNRSQQSQRQDQRYQTRNRQWNDSSYNRGGGMNPPRVRGGFAPQRPAISEPVQTVKIEEIIEADEVQTRGPIVEFPSSCESDGFASRTETHKHTTTRITTTVEQAPPPANESFQNPISTATVATHTSANPDMVFSDDDSEEEEEPEEEYEDREEMEYRGINTSNRQQKPAESVQEQKEEPQRAVPAPQESLNPRVPPMPKRPAKLISVEELNKPEPQKKKQAYQTTIEEGVADLDEAFSSDDDEIPRELLWSNSTVQKSGRSEVPGPVNQPSTSQEPSKVNVDMDELSAELNNMDFV